MQAARPGIQTTSHRFATLLAALLVCQLPGGTAVASDTSPQSLAHYALLEAALTRYRALAADSTLPALPPLPARSLRAGDSYAGVPALRQLLGVLGDLPEGARQDTPAFDESLAEGIRHFQRRHGLEIDGVVGPATWRALTTPLSRRVRQIEMTLERWRQLPPNPWQRAVFINIPQFRLIGMHSMSEAESEMLLMNVVVGRTLERLRTPTFVADMTHVIFRPYWDVPHSIAVRELLPEIRARPDYLEAQHYEVVNAAGEVVAPTSSHLDGVGRGTLRLRQRPGADNALGAVKFVMPNEHSVYLHDTPQRALFARARRAFSHGCVRIADPVALAQFALQGMADWTPSRIAEAMAADVPLRVDLAEPIRVYIVYGTAIARANGEVLFFDDLYGLDGA
jgi:murein L,D-transpeptidase YcbB/YkuD